MRFWREYAAVVTYHPLLWLCYKWSIYHQKAEEKKKQQKKQLYIWSMFKVKCKNLINLTKLDANIVVTIKFNVLCIMFTNFERTQFQHMKWKKVKTIYQSGTCLPSLKKRLGLRRFLKMVDKPRIGVLFSPFFVLPISEIRGKWEKSNWLV